MISSEGWEVGEISSPMIRFYVPMTFLDLNVFPEHHPDVKTGH